MAKSVFSKVVKSLWVLLAFIPLINGLGFTYIGAKEFKQNWIIEGFIYELPWFLFFLFLDIESISYFFVYLGLILMLICIIRTLYVYFKYKSILIDDDPESRISVEKSFNSYWVIFSVIPFLNGVGLIIVGMKRNLRRWLLEGLFFEFLWILYFITFNIVYLRNFLISLSMVGIIITIMLTIIIYFEEEAMDGASQTSAMPNERVPDSLSSSVGLGDSSSILEKSSEVIPELKGYEKQINDLKDSFDLKENSVTELINKRFTKGELTYTKFMSVIDGCHKLFYSQVDSAQNIINLAPDYTPRIEDALNNKICVMNSLIDEMNNLIEELIINDGISQKSDEEIKEVFDNMHNLVNSVEDYN